MKLFYISNVNIGTQYNILPIDSPLKDKIEFDLARHFFVHKFFFTQHA